METQKAREGVPSDGQEYHPEWDFIWFWIIWNRAEAIKDFCQTDGWGIWDRLVFSISPDPNCGRRVLICQAVPWVGTPKCKPYILIEISVSPWFLGWSPRSSPYTLRSSCIWSTCGKKTTSKSRNRRIKERRMWQDKGGRRVCTRSMWGWRGWWKSGRPRSKGWKMGRINQRGQMKM